MTKEKLLEMMKAKPAATCLFIDQKNSRLYRTHYLGIGEHFAIDSSEDESLVADLLSDGTLVATKTMVGCREMKMEKQIDGNIKTEPTSTMRKGYSIELR
jgi:hypothetical protein